MIDGDKVLTIKIAGGGALTSQTLDWLPDALAAQKLVADLSTLVPVSFAT